MFNAEAVPVMLVPTKVDGVPKFGVTKVGDVDKTTLPEPVAVVTPVPPLATGSVPEKLVAVTPVNPAPLPEKLVAVIVPALKFPDPSLNTIVFAVLEAVAVVAELDTFPAVAIVANLVSSISAVSDILLLSIAPAATNGLKAVPDKSPANWIFPFANVVASGVPFVIAVPTYVSTALTLGYIVVEPVSVVMFDDKLIAA